MRLGFIFGCLWVWGASVLPAAELVQLNENTWDEYVVQGKEADGIYGDLVLRNDRIAAVIAAPISTRNANMTVRNVGWTIIDLTLRAEPNDQLSAFYPGSGRHSFTGGHGQIAYQVDDALPEPLVADKKVEGRAISILCTADSVVGRPDVIVRYTLADGDSFISVETIYRNSTDTAYTEDLDDTIRADGPTFQMGVDAATSSFFADDDWFRQTYGIVCPGYSLEARGDRSNVIAYKKENSTQLHALRGETKFTRKLFPARSRLDQRGLAARLSGARLSDASLLIRDARGPIRQARIEVTDSAASVGTARTGEEGRVVFSIAAGEYQLTVTALGRPQRTLQFTIPANAQQAIDMEPSGMIVARITSGGAPTPCKISLNGIEGTMDPDFGPTTTVPVKNVFYSHDGRFSQEVPAGKYQVIISYGPEYDAVIRSIEVAAGNDTPLEAELVRSVDTSGWISADFHSHSTPSGDNTCDQRARVLNLLCEHIEFAPCTEHNRIDTYIPHLEAMKVRHLMQTCSGIELTGQPLPINHQNAFPLTRKPRTQDNGAPLTDGNPIVQIKRLAMCDDASDKLVQINHPNLVQMIGDVNEDGMPDGGFAEMFQHADVIEVHPLQSILLKPGSEDFKALKRNPIFHWMQMLNLGYRHTGVVNTDAHYSFHESGGLRNYIRASTDDPAKVEIAEMVQRSTGSNLVMTNGPFMTVEANAGGKSAIPGENLTLTHGELQLHIRVQCPNWLDINRVVVYVNGRPDEQLDFSRQSGGEHFSNDVVKFDARLPVKLTNDAHLIVCAAGEGLMVGPVMGPSWGKQIPIAVANPIFVDVNSDGFHANGDLLETPLPIEKTHLPAR